MFAVVLYENLTAIIPQALVSNFQTIKGYLLCACQYARTKRSKSNYMFGFSSRFIKQDEVCIARFKTSNVICIETFAKFQPMGRFTLRDEGIQIESFCCSDGLSM